MGSGDSRPATNRNECYVQSEMMNSMSGTPVPFAQLQSTATATVKIVDNHGYGSGFFVVLPINCNGKDFLYGLMTNNHVLDEYAIGTGRTITFQMKQGNEVHRHKIGVNDFRFTCPLIDVTFVELDPENYGRDNFLIPEDRCEPGSRIYITQYPGGGELCLAQGRIRSIWGFDILHEVSTDYGSSGSPLLNQNGRVVGVHKARRPNEECNVATRIGVVISAIQRMLKGPRQDARFATAPARNLTHRQKQELSNKGLQETTAPNVFISPSSTFVTTLWFYRTNHAWYWTPREPNSVTSLSDLQECNWSIIGETDPIIAIGGYWDGRRPADRNVTLITWLGETRLRFL